MRCPQCGFDNEATAKQCARCHAALSMDAATQLAAAQVAADRLRRYVPAVVADSAWADEQQQLDRMGNIPIGPLALPVLPYEPALVNALIGADLSAARPIAVVGSIAPRAVMFIHSADDQRFYAEKGFASDPKRCVSCRASRNWLPSCKRS